MSYSWLNDVVSGENNIIQDDEIALETAKTTRVKVQSNNLGVVPPPPAPPAQEGDDFAVDLLALLSPSKTQHETDLTSHLFCRESYESTPEAQEDDTEADTSLHSFMETSSPLFAHRSASCDEALPPLVEAVRGARESPAWNLSFEDTCPVLEDDCPSQDIDAECPQFADPIMGGGGGSVRVEDQVDGMLRDVQESWLASSEIVNLDFDAQLSSAQLWGVVRTLQMENQQLKEVNAQLQLQRQSVGVSNLQSPSTTTSATSIPQNGMNAAAAAWGVAPLMQLSSPLHQAVSPLHTATGTPLSPMRFATNSTEGADTPQMCPLSPMSEARDMTATPNSPLIEGLEKPDSQIDKAKLKTKLCKYFMQTQTQEGCPFFGRHGWCAFAHGEKELLTPYTPIPVSPLMPLSPTGAFLGDMTAPMSPFSLSSSAATL